MILRLYPNDSCLDHQDLEAKGQVHHVDVGSEALFMGVLMAAALDFAYISFVSKPMD